MGMGNGLEGEQLREMDELSTKIVKRLMMPK
jgi:hypothetical protein